MQVRTSRRLAALALCFGGCSAPSYDRSDDASANVDESDASAADRGKLESERYDARVEAARDATPRQDGEDHDASPPSDLLPDDADQCGPVGTQILQIESQVEWDRASIDLLGIPFETVHGGAGRVRILAIAKSERTANDWTVTVRPCWGEVPDFSAFDRKFGVYIPDESFDRMDRTWTTTMHGSCTRPDCVITSDKLIVQLGIQLDPEAEWPAREANVDPSVFVDEERDGQPGLTAFVRGPEDPGGYSYVPTPTAEQLDRLYLAVRLSSDLVGRLSTCDVTEGSGRTPALSLRAIGCRVAGSGRACTANEVTLANANLPDWRVPKFAWKTQRAPDTITCEQARVLSDVGGE